MDADLKWQLEAMENREAHMEFGLSTLADRARRMDEQLRSLTVTVGAIRFAVDGLAADSADVLHILRSVYGEGWFEERDSA
ncbi:hypothetical protein [Nocardia sp. CS682]|uniref:hypothetical protein n=1 Tax=Nocardia sp. CS682 TaxID=1047172 RepID=UPI0010753DE8|nr:hypothetical protein [Nocardia sp. CS682]QBS40603.1 hypothetical protein DMB37_11170 [Nocardia sp. CS682]